MQNIRKILDAVPTRNLIDGETYKKNNKHCEQSQKF